MTWWRGDDRYEVFFNRDELKTRSRALPPEVRSTEQGVRYLAPTDPDAGGTWMLVNEHGVTVCLLNRWHESAAVPVATKSRGQLVVELAGAVTAADVIARLRETACDACKPFTVVAFDRADILVEAWDGKRMFSEEAEAPLTSSSYCFPEVSRARYQEYQRVSAGQASPEVLHGYQSGGAEQSAFTVRMNRPDAQTWSRSHLCVGAGHIRWQYLEELPDLAGEPIEHRSELDCQI